MAVPGALGVAGPAGPLLPGGPQGPGAPASPLEQSYYQPSPDLSSSYGNTNVQAFQHPTASPDGTYMGGSQQQWDAMASQVPQGPQFMTEAMQKYVNQFNQSQAAQQQSINAGLVQALAGLGSRRDAASKVAATLPGEYDKAYLHATANQQQAQKNAAFGHDTIGGNANEPLITAANTQQQAAGHANQPLLEAGIAADYSKGATTLANTKMQNEADVAAGQRAFDMQMLQSQAQFQQGSQDKTAQYAHDREMAILNSQLGIDAYKAQNPNKSLTFAQQEANNITAANDQRAVSVGFRSAADANAATSDPYYSAVATALTPGSKGGRLPNGINVVAPGGDRTKLLQQVAASNLNTLRALLFNHVINDADWAAATGQPVAAK